MATEKKTTAQKAATKKATAKKPVAKKAAKAVVKHIGLVKNDPYLADYEDAIKGRHDHALCQARFHPSHRSKLYMVLFLLFSYLPPDLLC